VSIKLVIIVRGKMRDVIPILYAGKRCAYECVNKIRIGIPQTMPTVSWHCRYFFSNGTNTCMLRVFGGEGKEM